MELPSLVPSIEAILFAADQPATLKRIGEVFGDQSPPEEELKNCLDLIKQRYQDPQYGFELREAQGGYHFCTKMNQSEWVRKYLATKPFRLGRSSLEVLSIIAYRQPITRADIDQVRGIDSSHLLRTLIERGLVRMAGKAEIPGRPVQYATTPKFLEIVGLKTIGELPPLTELEQVRGSVDEPLQALEEGLDRIISEMPTEAERIDNTEELKEIDTLIKSTEMSAKGEVFESPLHKEVAEENQLALESGQQFLRSQRRKKPASMTFEEVSQFVPPSEPVEDEAKPVLDV